MKFDLWHKVLVGIGVVLLLLGCVAGWAAISAREDKIKADAENAANQKIIQQNELREKQRDIDEQKRVADRQQADAANLASQARMNAQILGLQQTIANLKTPQEHAAFDQQSLASLIPGIQFQVNKETGKLEATVPSASIPKVTEAIEQCQECQVKLAGAQQSAISKDEIIASLKSSLSDKDATIGEKNNSLKLLQDSVNDYKKTAGGGSFLHKFKVVLRDAACAGVGGAAGASMTSAKPKGAAVGAAIGVIGCTLAFK